MRLWHIDIVEHLPRTQLLGQHRECCALRGNGWGKKHRVVDYVFEHSPLLLYAYHLKVMNEMEKRGYKPSSVWRHHEYRGANCPPWNVADVPETGTIEQYPEHNEPYLQECLENLKNKGIIFDSFRSFLT